MQKLVSKSRTYVAMCNNRNFDGFYFRKFCLPEQYENNAEQAVWYFLNELDLESCVEKCFAAEDLADMKTVSWW